MIIHPHRWYTHNDHIYYWIESIALEGTIAPQLIPPDTIIYFYTVNIQDLFPEYAFCQNRSRMLAEEFLRLVSKEADPRFFYCDFNDYDFHDMWDFIKP
jgi:hypothetical protein